jgi:hypothetical protein
MVQISSRKQMVMCMQATVAVFYRIILSLHISVHLRQSWRRSGARDSAGSCSKRRRVGGARGAPGALLAWDCRQGACSKPQQRIVYPRGRCARVAGHEGDRLRRCGVGGAGRPAERCAERRGGWRCGESDSLHYARVRGGGMGASALRVRGGGMGASALRVRGRGMGASALFLCSTLASPLLCASALLAASPLYSCGMPSPWTLPPWTLPPWTLPPWTLPLPLGNTDGPHVICMLSGAVVRCISYSYNDAVE